MAQNDAVQQHGGVCSRGAHPRVGEAADGSCFNLWEHEKYIYINQIYKLYNRNNTCADQQPYLAEKCSCANSGPIWETDLCMDSKLGQLAHIQR